MLSCVEKIMFSVGIAEPAVDIVYVAERYSIDVRRVTDAPWFGAMDIGHDNNPPTIFVCNNKDWYWQRIILAHELGHMFLHKNIQVAFRDYQFDISNNEKLEKEANQFALDLLIPAPWLLAFSMYETVQQMSKRFEVPVEIINYRVTQLNIKVK